MLEELIAASEAKRANLGAVYLYESALEYGDGVDIETCLLFAPRGSVLIATWLDEYERCLRMGVCEYAVLAQEQGVRAHPKRFSNYFAVFASLHVALQRLQHDHGPIVLRSSRYTIFKLHSASGWEPERMKQAFASDEARTVPLIKLTGPCRPLFPDTYTFPPLPPLCGIKDT
jgi:hypothetical protein